MEVFESGYYNFIKLTRDKIYAKYNKHNLMNGANVNNSTNNVIEEAATKADEVKDIKIVEEDTDVISNTVVPERKSTELKSKNYVFKNQVVKETLEVLSGNESLKRIVRKDNIKGGSLIAGLHESSYQMYPAELFDYDTNDTNEYKDLFTEILKLQFPKQKVLYNTIKHKIPFDIEIPSTKGTILGFVRSPINQRIFPHKEYEDYLSTFVYFYNHIDLQTYIPTLKQSKVDIASYSKTPYKILDFPKSINIALREIYHDFEKYKNALKFNQETGFYGLIAIENGTYYDVICKHDYMLKTNIPIETVIAECSKKGYCKYCDEELSDQDFIDITGLPGQIRTFVYQAIEILNNGVADDNLINEIAHLIGLFVTKLVPKYDMKFTDKTIALSAVLIYRILSEFVDRKKIPEIPSDIIASFELAGNAVNWSFDKLKELSKTELFSKSSDISDVILRRASSTKKIMVDHDNVQSDIAKEFKSRHDLATIYVLLNNYILSDICNPEIKIPKNNEVKNVLSSIMISLEEMSSTFEYYIQENCPIKILHSFKGDVCTHCGYNKLKSNAEEIYNKYHLSWGNIKKKENNAKFSAVKNNRFDAKSTIDLYKIDNVSKQIAEILNVDSIKWNEIVMHLNEISQELINTFKVYYNNISDNLSKDDILKLLFHLYKTEKNTEIIYMLLYYDNILGSMCSKLNDVDDDVDLD
jgi:hypothetical protein